MKSNSLSVFVAFTVFLGVFAEQLAGQTVLVKLPDAKYEGKPLYVTDSEIALLSRDGQIVAFHPSQAESFEKISTGFRPYSQATIRGQLLREFGRRFDVTGTGQFLVVHPVGQRDQWAGRFEELYRSMLHYYRARGFKLRKAQFPFIAVVFPTKPEYLNYMSRHGGANPNSLGYYDVKTNRIHLYDVTAGQSDKSRWYVNAETIIHEAAHQTAFNVGIHRRFANAPSWLVEGIGTLFEPRGVWDPKSNHSRESRVNQVQLENYQLLVNSKNSLDVLRHQLASDRVFRQNSRLAYAHAWALTFYLTETEPRRYAKYVELTYRRKPFELYSTEERMRDFVSIFGADLKLFDARLQRFMESL